MWKLKVQHNEITKNLPKLEFRKLFIIFGQNNYSAVNIFLNTSFGKFIVISLCWTFSFHILNELRHLVWDAGYGFDLKVANITGMIAFIGSFVLTILFYILGRNFF